MVIRVVLALAAAACVEGSSPPPSWLGNYYKLALLKESPIWTIHGLWPEWAEGYCKEVKFNESKIQDLEPELNKYWISDQGNNTAFWAHEWEKHGSCTPFDEHTYFTTTLNLYHKYNHLCPTDPSDPTSCSICMPKNFSVVCSVCNASCAN